MTTIWKYELPLGGKTTIEIPSLYVDDSKETIYKTAKQVLHFGLQNEVPTIWVQVDPKAPKQKLNIELVGTGFQCPMEGYVGTVVMFDGSLVLHAFIELD